MYSGKEWGGGYIEWEGMVNMKRTKLKNSVHAVASTWFQCKHSSIARCDVLY